MHGAIMILAFFTLILTSSSAQNAFFREADYRQLYPLMSIAVQLQNHAHALPYFFGLLENLDYPKDQILIDIYIETHIDATLSKTKQWVNDARKYYRSIFLTTDMRNYQEEALMKARNSKAKYVLYLKNSTDVDEKEEISYCPLLFAPFGDPPTVKVPPEPLLLDLSHSDSSFLTFSSDNLYGYSENNSDEPNIVLENSASRMNISFFLDNEYFYGYFFNHSLRSLDFQRKMLRYLLADWIANSGLMPIVHSSFLKVTYPRSSLLVKAKMIELLKLMGFEYTWWKATDGHQLESEPLYGEVELLPDYEDPYYKRPMKTGELKKMNRVIVFEDDLRFVVNSTDLLKELIEDIDSSEIEWDLIYLGRKRLEGANENWVPGHRHLSTVDYSYWTLVDEYIPIMFDKHPNMTWRNAFPNRDLIAYTIYPTIVVPERYTYQPGYISDTEDSDIVDAESGKLILWQQHKEKMLISNNFYVILIKRLRKMGCICGKPDLEIGMQQYRILKPFAKGGFSQLFLVEECKTGHKRALKRIDCHSKTDVKRVQNEIDMQQRFGIHPNILSLKCFADDEIPHGLRFSLIFNFYERGTLQDELTDRRPCCNYIVEERVVRLFLQIASAIKFMHSSSPPIAHRDIKPANVLLSDDDRPMLMDFGSCFACPIIINDGKDSRMQLDEAGELCSMPYRAPELFVCEVGSVIDQSLDIWVFAWLLLFALCFFRSPFDDIYERGDSIALAIQSKILDAIRLMIAVDPKDRPSIISVCELLEGF
ncbi:Serine/threonine-protein kinase [Dirofilaria immitis]|nr:Serine/threonine-protein kinase [Dirofilaria immitis]